MTDRKKTFIGGAAMLAGAGVLGKVVAAFYRVWLNALIGPVGLGIYQIPSNYYAFLLVMSTAGIPTAISKLVSESLAKNDETSARETFVAARRVLFFTGFAATILMAALAKPLASAAGEPDAYIGFFMLSPALFIVCMLSAYRGYFQGWQRMKPSAVSQVVEQIGRLILGFGLAILWAPKGVAWGAAGAILGVTLCEVCALVFIMGSYAAHKRAVPIKIGKVDFKRIAARIFKIAIPVTIGSSIMPLVGLADTMTVINRLVAAGFEPEKATAVFGIFSGMVQAIINMPSVVTLALSISLVPAISGAMTVDRRERAATTAKEGMKLASLIGFPSAFGMFLLAGPIMRVLGQNYTAEQYALSVQLLSIMAFSVIFVSINQTTTGILQGYGKPLLPVFSLGTGAVIKVIMNYVLIAMPSINIFGGAAGSVICYAIASALNIVSVTRVSGMKFEFSQILLRPMLAALGMAAVVWVTREICGKFLGGSAALGLAVAAGVLSYAIFVLISGAVTRTELKMLPGGRHIIRLLTRLRVYKES